MTARSGLLSDSNRLTPAMMASYCWRRFDALLTTMLRNVCRSMVQTVTSTCAFIVMVFVDSYISAISPKDAPEPIVSTSSSAPFSRRTNTSHLPASTMK